MQVAQFLLRRHLGHPPTIRQHLTLGLLIDSGWHPEDAVSFVATAPARPHAP